MISLLKKSIQSEQPCLPGLVMSVLFLSLPNLVAVFWPRLDRHHVENFWFGVGILLAPCLFSVTVRTALRLWVPLAAFLPALLTYQLVTGEPVREWALVVLGETDASELERFWAPAVFSVLAAPCAVAFLWWFTGRHLPAGHRLGWLGRSVVLICLLVMPLGQMAFGGWGLGAQVAVKRLATTFPSNLPVSAWRAWDIHQDFAGRPVVADRVEVKSVPLGEREIHVLVLGEAARFDSLQLNGYARETTPLLAKTPGLLSFQDVIALAPVTSMSIPLLLTPASPEAVHEAASLPSVVGVFRKAGFHTAWYSTQRKHGTYDTAAAIFAADADDARFLSGNFAPGDGRYPSAHDGALLQPLKELLAAGHPRLFIVLHTMGSHQNYADRYPPEFNHFPAERQDIASRPFVRALSAEQREHISNAYDNSIRYMDWFLAQVIELLEQSGAVGMMLYVSDHGQNKGDAETLPFAHGNLTAEVLHVPMLVWLSPGYRAQRPDRTMRLELHIGTPFTGSAIFHTVADAAGLECDALDPRLSAASAQFRPGTRWVRSLKGELVDYDKLAAALHAARPAAAMRETSAKHPIHEAR